MRVPFAAAVVIAATIASAPAVAQTGGTASGSPAAAERPAGPGSGYGMRGHGWGPGMMMGPGMMGMGRMGRMCDPRAAGLAEWRMERIERMVNPNESQRAALENLRNASAKAADIVAAACPREFPANASARLALMEKRLDAMQQAVKIVRPAFDAFYAALNDEQKARVNAHGGRHWGWRGWHRG